jgi:hypothetical protein
VVQNFNGLSDLDTDNLNGFANTPPDQVCAGRDQTRGQSRWRLGTNQQRGTRTNRNGMLRPDVSLATLFQDH